MTTAPDLRVVPDRVVWFMDIELLPGDWNLVTSVIRQQTRLRAARAVAEFPLPWLARAARRIPGIRGFFRERDQAARVEATAQLRLDYVAVGNYQRPPDKCNELPIAGRVDSGHEISVRVTNTGDRSLVARVIVEGELT